jgi:hypothetical protein
MPHPQEVTNMALFCDFENIALASGREVREVRHRQKVLERLL